MKPNILSTIILPLLMLSMQHCDDPLTELEKLPPATQSGKRTFGCLVDGKAWVTEGITDAGGFYQTGTLSVSAGLSNSTFRGNMSFHIFDLDLKVGTYILGEKLNQADSEYARYFNHKILCEFYTNSVKTGILNITHLDKANFIVSGTFEFEAYSADCTQIMEVTNGRFDIDYAA